MKTLYVTDLDGTLMRDDKIISNESTAILNRLLDHVGENKHGFPCGRSFAVCEHAENFYSALSRVSAVEI